MTIYLVSSIGISPAIQGAFQAGVHAVGGAAAGAPVVTHVSQGYGMNLKGAISRIVPAGNDILVTLGGLVSFVAALEYSRLDFISLVGGTVSVGGDPFPAAGTRGVAGGYFRGCVSLETYASDPVRIHYLNQNFNYAQDQITLLYNPNSYMAATQVSYWPTNAQRGGVDGNGANNNSFFVSAFQKITTPAIVISADPFFYDNMQTLIDAANRSNKFICYPLQDYNNAALARRPGSGLLYGPSLLASGGVNGAIWDLGHMAGRLYNTPGTIFSPQLEANIITPI
jgi:hypothetical protein